MDSRLQNYMNWLEERGLYSPTVARPKAQTNPTATILSEPSPLSMTVKTPIFLFAVTTAADLAHPPSLKLLKKIIEATLIDISQVQILPEEALVQKLELFTPKICLCFGSNLEKDASIDAEIISLPALGELQTHPALKRQVWDTLQQLMNRPNFPKQIHHS